MNGGLFVQALIIHFTLRALGQKNDDITNGSVNHGSSQVASSSVSFVALLFGSLSKSFTSWMLPIGSDSADTFTLLWSPYRDVDLYIFDLLMEVPMMLI